MTTPATIRYGNPGGMYPGPSASRFGSGGYGVIGGGHQIASFDDPVAGAAALFDLYDRGYSGMSLADATRKWSGGNSADAYTSFLAKATGLAPDTVITQDMLRNPSVAIPLAKAKAQWETGQPYPLSDDQWSTAHARAFGGDTSQISRQTGISPAPMSPPRGIANAAVAPPDESATGISAPDMSPALDDDALDKLREALGLKSASDPLPDETAATTLKLPGMAPRRLSVPRVRTAVYGTGARS